MIEQRRLALGSGCWRCGKNLAQSVLRSFWADFLRQYGLGVSGQLLRVVEGSRLICYLKQLRTIVAVKALIPANADEQVT